MKKIAIILCLTTFFITSCVMLRDSDEAPSPVVKREQYIYTENVRTSEAESDLPSSPLEKAEFNDPFAGTNISVAAVGDNLIHSNIWLDAAARAKDGREFDFRPMYENVALTISEADIAFINQESIMAGVEFGYTAWPSFNCPQQLGLDLVELGFDVINIANNHLIDKGESGMKKTLDFWHEQPVTVIGGYYNKEDYDKIRVTEHDGVKIAWLSYTYGTNGIVLPASSELVIPNYKEKFDVYDNYNDDMIISDMKKAEEVGDITIVSIHWGNEGTHVINEEQKRMAKLISSLGAEVILGHHSHTIQPIEWLESDWGKTLCIYSLGNFTSGQAGVINMVGGIFSFNIESDGFGGLEITSPLFTPTVTYYGMDWMNTNIYFLEDYTKEIADTHGLAINGRYLSVDDAYSMVKNTIDSEFLPDYLK